MLQATNGAYPTEPTCPLFYELLKCAGCDMNFMKTILPFLAMSGFLSDSEPLKNDPNRILLSEIDIEKEYELIQQKKSKLSKMQRDSVIWKYNQLKNNCESVI